jgi:hypothetical protein
VNHIVEDNTGEWDLRVQREQERKDRRARLAHRGISAGVLLGLVALSLALLLRPKQMPAVAVPPPPPAKAVDPPLHGIEASLLSETPEPHVLDGQAQTLAVDLARIWRDGESEGAAETAHTYTVEYEQMVGCDLRWIAGRAGPGVWKGTRSLVRSLHELTPHVGRAREGQAVVVTAVICPHVAPSG